jgi:hypothetical protein
MLLCNSRTGIDVSEYTARCLVDVLQTQIFFDNLHRIPRITESLTSVNGRCPRIVRKPIKEDAVIAAVEREQWKISGKSA